MSNQLISDLFNKTRYYRDTFPLFFYEITWDILKKEGLIQESTPRSLLENYFYGCVLLDLYRKFEGIAIGETWSMQDELDYPEEFGYQYQNICQLLNIEPVCIYDFYTQNEIQENEWTQSDIAQILKEEQPSFAELYVQYIRKPYRQKLFSTLKKQLTSSDLYAILMNAVAYDHFDQQYQEWEENTNEDYECEYFDIKTLEDFKESLKRNEMHILSDMEFIRAYEWLDTIY